MNQLERPCSCHHILWFEGDFCFLSLLTCIIQPIFVKSSTTSNNVKPKKLHVVNPPKRPNDRNNSYCRNYSNVRNDSYGRNYSNFRNNSYNRNYSNNSYDKNNSYVHHVHKPTCFYCNTKGHTLNPLYIRNYGVSYGEHVWVEKGFS